YVHEKPKHYSRLRHRRSTMFSPRSCVRTLLRLGGARTPARRPPRKTSTLRLGLEVLETREMLSANFPGYTLSGGNLYQTVGAQQQLIDTSVKDFAVLNNTVVDLHTDQTLQTMNNDGSGKTTVGNNILFLAVAGNGDLVTLNTVGDVNEQPLAEVVGTRPRICNLATQIAIAGNGDVIMFQASTGNLYEHTPGAAYYDSSRICNLVTQFAIAGNADVIMFQESTGNLYEHTQGA